MYILYPEKLYKKKPTQDITEKPSTMPLFVRMGSFSEGCDLYVMVVKNEVIEGLYEVCEATTEWAMDMERV
jgi:hypothetical protein